jgi:glycosyltransferase involved in cell wall biosynthesis
MLNFKVGNFPAQPHCFAFGGFDIQMNRVIDQLCDSGTESIKVNPWDADCKFEIAHFWGGEISHSTAFRFCKDRSLPCVFSILLPNMHSGYSLYFKLRQVIRRVVKGELIYQRANFVTVINSSQALVAQHILGLPQEKIRIIPTIIDDIFFGEQKKFSARSDTILCVGTIGPRKNQLMLLQAAERLGLKVILCGRYDDEHLSYSAEVSAIIKRNINLFEHYSDISPSDLFALYMHCKLVACVSVSETEPASVLEGMICGCQTIVSSKPFGRNPKFEGAVYCNPSSIESIKKSIRLALSHSCPIYSSFSPDTHRRDSVIELYKNLYAECLM